jgi:hypothetical protein
VREVSDNKSQNKNDRSTKIKNFSENYINIVITPSTIFSSPDSEDIIRMKRKIESITQYLKPNISKILYKVLQINQDNIKITCDYIIAEQNEINIKESTKETKMKKLVIYPVFLS